MLGGSFSRACRPVSWEADVRVLVTRPEASARRTAQKLSALGHEPVLAPVLRIESTDQPPPAENFDAILLTSANAVPALGRLDSRRKPVFTVGERTAARAREAGFEVRSAGGDARALTALLRTELPPPASLLHVAGLHRKPEPQASLEALDYGVIVWTAYAARKLERLPASLVADIRAGRADAALHYSRRSAEILLQLAGEAGISGPLLAIGHACLSDDVAQPFRAAGAARVVVAEHPSEEALLARLVMLAPPVAARLPGRGDAKDGTNVGF